MECAKLIDKNEAIIDRLKELKVRSEMINIYKDLLKIKDTRITTLLWFVGILAAAVIAMAIIAIIL